MAKKIVEHFIARKVAYLLSLCAVAIGIGFYFSFFFGGFAQGAVTGVTLADTDTSGFGLDGRDFLITWTPGEAPVGYVYTQLYITTSGVSLATNTLAAACVSPTNSGGTCMPVGYTMQYTNSSWPLPQMRNFDSSNVTFSASSTYVAWVFVSTTDPGLSSIVSSTAVSYASSSDSGGTDTMAPMIDHMSVYQTLINVTSTLYAVVMDDQVTAAQFADPSDEGSEYFKIHYGKDVSVSEATSTGATVAGTGGLFSFTVPSSFTTTSFEYYLEAQDRAGTPNKRFFCSNPSATTANECQASPFTVSVVAAGSREITGTITTPSTTSPGSVVPVEGVHIYTGGFAATKVTTNENGVYTISGLRDNSYVDIVAMKQAYCKQSRMENIGTVNKTGINISINSGECGFYGGGYGGGGMSSAPMVTFSSPPDGMSGFPAADSIRVSFNQPLSATEITDLNAADAGSNIYLSSDGGTTKVAGTVTYCANNSAAGCTSLFSGDMNTILFDPTASLATGTFYTLVLSGAIKGESGQAIQGNRPAGGHQISFTTIGGTFTSGQYTMGSGGQFMPPYVRSMTPAPGMSVSPNMNILLEFNEAMDATTANTTNITLWKGATQITSGVGVSLDSNEKRFLTITHGTLDAGSYEVRVNGAVANASGITMLMVPSGIAFSSAFTVAGISDAVAPTVYPMLANNSTGVAVNNPLEFGFNEQLSFSTVNTTNVTLRRGATVVSINVRYDPGINDIIVTPDDALVPSTVYTLTLGSGIQDLAGNVLATSTYTYTTGSADTAAPSVIEARCDDYTCTIRFTEPMNRDVQGGSEWASSTLNHVNFDLRQGGADKIVTSTMISYDYENNAVEIKSAGLTVAEGNFTLIVRGVTDASGNVIVQSTIVGPVENSATTFGSFGGQGMFGPPTAGMMGGGAGGTIGGGEFIPMGFGNFTPDQFMMGQADMAYPFNQMAGQDCNVFQVRFSPGVVVQANDQVVITFPNGTTVTGTAATGAALDTLSPYYADFNQFGAGVITGSAITSVASTNKVTITLGVTGTPLPSDQLSIDLRKITNPIIPKGPSTSGYTVTIQIIRAGTVLATKTSMPYFINEAGTNSIVLGVVAGTATTSPADGANGTVYLHGGGPSGPMEKTLTLTNGVISSVNGVAKANTTTYTGLQDGCYFIGTDPFLTLGSNDYFGQMSPEPFCVSNSQTLTKYILLTSASAAGASVTTTVKLVGPVVSDNAIVTAMDIFASGPGRFIVKTLNAGDSYSDDNGVKIKLPSNGMWMIGVGPSMPKGTSGGKPTQLPGMPPPPMSVNVSGVGGDSPSVSLSGSLPPSVTFTDNTDTVTFTFAAADKVIAGTVKDGSGNALSSVNVFAHRQGFGMPTEATTNASGTFSLNVSENGTYEIGVMKDGMPPIFKQVEVRPDGIDDGTAADIYINGKQVTDANPLILTMKKSSYTISGKVLDSSNNGISYAPVMAIDANGNSVFSGTGLDGSYSLFVDNGTWTVRSELPPSKTDSCGTFSKTVTVSGASQANQNITPSVSTCLTLSGTVTVGSGNLANVPLFIEEWNVAANQPVPLGIKKNASTDSNGAYSVKVAGSKTYRIGTWHPDYGELSATKTVTTVSTTQNVSVAATSSIIFVFTGGTADMNAMIELKNVDDNHQAIRKSQNGLASNVALIVEEDVTYDYFVDIMGVNKFTGRATATTTIDTGIVAGTTDFVTVTGTIYSNVSTSTISGALVTFINTTTGMIQTALTNASGTYSINIKAGSYKVAAEVANYVPGETFDNATFTTTTAGYDFGGAAPDQDALEVASYTIEGVVSSSVASTVMSEGYVSATNAEGITVTAAVGSDGAYALPVTAGSWTLDAVGPSHAETTRVGAVVVTTADVTGTNFTLTADATKVSTSTTGVITANTGGSINDTNGCGIKLTVGQGVLSTASEDISVTMEREFDAPDTVNYQALGNASFAIEATGNSVIKTLSGSAEIQLDYTDLLADLPAGVSESNLKLMYFSPERGEYVPVEGGFTVDTSTNRISGLVDHFTDFVITYTYADAGVTLSGSADVTEGGTTDTYTVVLTSVPTANVTITLTPNAQITVSPSTLTFTAANWSTPQTVTVTAVDDSNYENAHTGTITHTISSSDTNYNSVSIGSVTVNVTDNDTPSGGSASPPPADTTPPTNTSIVIANGAGSTDTAATTLTIGATGADSMMISNTSAFTGATWETYATSKTWVLTSGAGIKTVYVKFKDAAGNVSIAVSDTIDSTDTTVIIPVTPTETPTTPTETPITPTTPATPATPAAGTTNVTAQFTKYLGVGSKGEEVKQLQQLLKDLGYFTHPSITGYFGNVTKAAVVKFQKAKGLSPFPGFVGPGTRAALNELTAGAEAADETAVVEETPAALVTPTGYQFKNYLYIGSQGEAVKQLQQILKDLGYFTHPSITGYFGSVTKAAVVEFQKAKNLSPYPGWLGPQTRAALNELSQ